MYEDMLFKINEKQERRNFATITDILKKKRFIILTSEKDWLSKDVLKAKKGNDVFKIQNEGLQAVTVAKPKKTKILHMFKSMKLEDELNSTLQK